MKRFFPLMLCFFLLISVPLLLFAQEKEVILEEVVVTATRDVQPVRKVPANVTVITKEEIERSYSQNVVDLMRDEVGVVVRDYYGTGKYASVDIRGFGETGLLNTLVLVDGRRVNEIDLSGVDWTQIPLNQIERIEVVRGAGTVLYGDNAVGGVVNIITKRPEKPFSGEAGIVLGGYDYHKERGSVGGMWGPLSAMLNAAYSGTDGYRDNGFLRTRDIGGRVIYDLDEDIRFNLSGSFHQDNTGLPGGLTEAQIDTLGRQATVRPNDKAETKDWYNLLGIKAKMGNLGRIEADFSYRNREVEDFFRSFSFEDKRNLITWGFTPRYILESPLFTFSNKLTAGLDFYKSDSKVDTEFFGVFDRVEVSKKSLGLYFLDEFVILENLVLSMGGRWEHAEYDFSQDSSGADDSVRDQEPAWSIGLDYLFGKRSSAFLSVKRSFRFPVTDELIQFFPFQANPSLKPQTGYHYDAGIRYAFTDEIEANLTLFWIDLDDEIFFDPTIFPFGVNRNFPKTRRQGIEVGAKAKPFPWLLVWGNYGYTKPILRAAPFSGNDVPGAPRHKGSAGAEIRLGRGFEFYARVNVVGSSYLISDFANQASRLDGYYTVDMKFSYYWKGLKAFVGINNVFNQKYSEFATLVAGTQSFFPSPERNWFLGASYAF